MVYSLRMVADMSDDAKIMANLSGGSVGRQFHPYMKSQLKPWLKQQWLPWWLSKEKVLENSQHKLTLVPNAKQ